MVRSLSQGLPSSPAGLALITYAHNPWLVHVIQRARAQASGPRTSPAHMLAGWLLGGHGNSHLLMTVRLQPWL